MLGAGAEVSELLSTKRALSAEFGNHYRPRQNHFFALFVAKWNRPATKFVEALDSIDQVPEESVTPHLTIRQDFQSGALLYFDGFVDGAVFQGLEFQIADLLGIMTVARGLQISRPQQTS